MVEILVPLGLFAMIFGIVWVVSDRNIKRTLIQHGADAKSLKMDKDSNSALKFGLLLVGVAVGLLIGNLISESTSMQEEIAYLSMTFLFGGASLLIYNAVVKKQPGNKDGLQE
jgi:predicted MFS family arabinose efflux permease